MLPPWTLGEAVTTLTGEEVDRCTSLASASTLVWILIHISPPVESNHASQRVPGLPGGHKPVAVSKVLINNQ